MNTSILLNSVSGEMFYFIKGLSSEPRSIIVFEDLKIAIAGGTNGDIYYWDYMNSIL